MMLSRRRWLLGAAALFEVISGASTAGAQAVTGWSDNQLAKRLESYARLTPEDFARSVTIKDDDLEAAATLTTESGYRFKGGFTDRVRSDTFLRVVIGKASGTAVYQLYANLTYTGPYRDFDALSIGTAAGPVMIPATFSDHRIPKCSYGTCVSQDSMAFVLPEMLVREMAAKATDRPVVPVRFRLKSRSGEDWTDDMPPAEAAGLLIAVTSWRAKAPR